MFTPSSGTGRAPTEFVGYVQPERRHVRFQIGLWRLATIDFVAEKKEDVPGVALGGPDGWIVG